MYICEDCKFEFEYPVYFPEWSLDGVDLIGETLICPGCGSHNLHTYGDLEEEIE